MQRAATRQGRQAGTTAAGAGPLTEGLTHSVRHWGSAHQVMHSGQLPFSQCSTGQRTCSHRRGRWCSGGSQQAGWVVAPRQLNSWSAVVCRPPLLLFDILQSRNNCINSLLIAAAWRWLVQLPAAASCGASARSTPHLSRSAVQPARLQCKLPAVGPVSWPLRPLVAGWLHQVRSPLPLPQRRLLRLALKTMHTEAA